MLHYDASKLESLEYNTVTENGVTVTNVTKWKNIGTGGEAYVATAQTGALARSGDTWEPPRYAGGRIDFGQARTPRDMTFQEIADVRTVFWVVDIAQDISAFLLGNTNDKTYPFHRGGGGEYYNASAAGGVRGGRFWDNGLPVGNPSGEKIPTGLRVLSFVSSENLRVNSLTCDRDGGDAKEKRYGGRTLAELAIFNTRLDDADRQAVERHLRMKWLGAGLLVAGPGNGMDIAAEPAPGWTFGLTDGQTAACTAAPQAFLDGVHYRCIGCTLERWDEETAAWGAPETNENSGSYSYVPGAADSRVTWLYEPDGYRLDTGFSPPGSGSITVGTLTNLSDNCYATGTQVELTAVPAGAGFAFSQWVVDGAKAGTANPFTIRMDKIHTVQAVFASVPLTWAGDDSATWKDGAAGWLDAAGERVTWANGATARFTNDTPVTVTIAAEGVTATAVRFDGTDGAALEGGALTLINDARIVAMMTNAADIEIDAPVDGTDGLTLSYGKAPPPPFTDFLTTNDRLIFPGFTLAEIARIDAQMDGKFIGGGPIDATPYFVTTTNEDGSVSVQFQAVNSETKCVKVSFREGVDGIYAKVLWARYMKADTPLGTDFESGATENSVATSHGGNGYGICNLTATLPDVSTSAPGRFVIGQPAIFTGDLALLRGRLAFGAEGKLGAAGAFAGAVALAPDTVLETPPCEQAFNGAVTGAGRVLVQNAESDAPAAASFRGGASWTGGLTVGTNGFVQEVDTTKPLPQSGVVEAVDGGEIKLSCKGPDYTNPFHIRNGGVLALNQKLALRGNHGQPGRPVFLDNGKIRLDTSCLIYTLDVTNGGTVCGAPVWMNDSWYTNMITVHGNAPLIHQAGYTWNEASGTSRTFAMDVEDADGNIIFSGPVTGDAGGREMVKTGAGTVVFQGTNTYVNCTNRIDAGTLRFETDHAMGAEGNVIVLNGGTLDLGTGDNTEPGVGALALTRSSTLKLGEGKIAFAVSTNAWAGGAELTIEGEFKPMTVQFGKDEHGLIPEQIEKIKLAGDKNQKFKLDAAGWLCPAYSTGTVLIFR